MNKLIISAFVFVTSYGLENGQAQVHPDSIPPSGNIIIHHGVGLFDNEKYDEALQMFKQVSPCDPNYSKSCYEIALTYDHLGKLDQALQKCDESLNLDPDNVQSSILKGNLLDELGRRDDAIKWLEDIEKKYPYNQNLLYNLAICHINKGNLDKAETILIRGLHYNPYHASSHLALGQINFLMGRKAQSYLAYNMGIIMSPRIRNIQTLEEAICGKNDSISRGYRYPYPQNFEHTKWDKLTGLLNAEVAFRENFPYDYKLNYLNCRQTYMLVHAMMFEPGDTTFYNQCYVRFFKGLLDKNDLEPFFYYSLKNTDNKDVQEWLAKNKNLVDTFVDHARESINLWKVYGFSTVNESVSQRIYHFNDKGDFDAIGVLKDNLREGVWHFVSETGAVSQSGYYQNNKRNGEFLVFWPNGKLKQKLNYKNDNLDGENLTYHSNGVRAGVFPRNGGLADGREEEYNSAGRLISSTNYKMNMIDGNVLHVDFNGGFSRQIPYLNGRRSGMLTEKWLNSNKKVEAVYVDSLLNGTYRKWYANGFPEWEGRYENNIQVGKWISYYADGTKSAEGFLDEAGNPTGLYTEFDRYGKVKQNLSGYKGGKPDGIQTFYFPDGKESAKFTIRDDIYKRIDCYKFTGELVYSSEEKDSVLDYKFFYGEGVLKTEGIFKNGRKNGIWKSYNILGKVTSEENWNNGMQIGTQKYFHENGNPSLVYTCDSGKIVGKVARYFSNGHLSMFGYYDKDGPSGQWKNYYQNDSIESCYYYEKGRMVGRRMNYSPEGKLTTEETFNEDGEPTGTKYYGPDGSVIDEISFPFGVNSFSLHFPNGKLMAKIGISDRKKDGIQEYYFPNGQLKSQQTYISGNLQGKLTSWDHQGKLIDVRNYSMNELDGKYYAYEDGKLSFVDNYEMGTNQGLYQEFHPNGKIFRKIMIESGDRQGDSDCYAPDSTWMYKLRYRDNEFYSISYYDINGKLHADELIDNLKKEVICYFKNGKVSARLPFSNCIFNGKHVIYYSNGQLLREISYVNDYREGISKYYYENGKLKESCNWLNGARHGIYSLYFPNGQKKMEGNYMANKKQGKWLVFNELGNLVETLYYENDELFEIN